MSEKDRKKDITMNYALGMVSATSFLPPLVTYAVVKNAMPHTHKAGQTDVPKLVGCGAGIAVAVTSLFFLKKMREFSMNFGEECYERFHKKPDTTPDPK